MSGDILVFVRDSGPGLPPADQDSLFKAFYTTKPNGLGLGLSICRSIVEGHGGRLWASANAPGGAVFQFTLPVQWRLRDCDRRRPRRELIDLQRAVPHSGRVRRRRR